MKKGPSFKTMIIGLIVFGIGAVAAIPSAIIASKKYETNLSEAEDSLVWVYSELSTPVLEYEGSWSGTGFAVGVPGEDVKYIITNGHVIEQAYAWSQGEDDPFDLEKTKGISLNKLLDEYGMNLSDMKMKSSIRVYFSDDEDDYDEPEVIYYSGPSDRDIAILKLDKPTSNVKPILINTTYGTRYNEEVVSIGFPDVFKNDLNVSGFSHDNDDIIVTECNIIKFENKYVPLLLMHQIF